jgi:hypothetical protein
LILFRRCTTTVCTEATELRRHHYHPLLFKWFRIISKCCYFPKYMYTVHFFVFALRLGSIFVKKKEKTKQIEAISLYTYTSLYVKMYIYLVPRHSYRRNRWNRKKNKSLLYSGDGERPHETLTTPHVPARETIWVLLQKKKKGEPKKKNRNI